MMKKGSKMGDRSYRDHFNLSKRIPLHYQKRYLANISNGSFNATLMTGVYKNKIKTLLNNNRYLAIALQNDKAKKEELIEENKANANLIMFSRLKLASLSDNLKKVVTVLDETLALLQMHSSVSSSKFTPKHTLGREEFKEQVKDVLMDSIPEEPESPQEMPNKTNIEVAYPNKKQSDPVNDEKSMETQPDMSDKTHNPLKKPKSFKKISKHKNLNERSLWEITKGYLDSTNDGHCHLNTPLNNYEECSPVKVAATHSKKKYLNERMTLMSEARCKKVATTTAASKKGGKITKNAVWKDAKRVGSFNEDKNNKNRSPLKNDFNQRRLHNDIQIHGVQMPENNCNTENESKHLDKACTLKNSVSPVKLPGNIVNDNVISDCEKENKGSNKRPKLSTKRYKSLDDVELEPTVSKRKHGRSSALKSLSSKINIDNSKDNGGKGKTCQIDDLITLELDSSRLLLANKNPENCDASKSYLQDLSLHQQEMVRNLAENTYIVTAEVHKSSEPTKTSKIRLPKTECSVLKQPIVLVQDIFQSGKTFCKSISHPACGELNKIPLELQLLEHCSSLKVIQEESIHSRDDSTTNGSDPSEGKFPKSKFRNIEPPLSVEGEFMEQPLHEEKRTRRKRSVNVNYKEPPMNLKLRREK